MKTFTIEITGKTQSDVELALQEAAKIIEQGCHAGHNSNDDGSFNVESEGEYDETPKERLEYLRGQLRAECISYLELVELQDLAEYIEAGDVELLEPAGVPEEGGNDGQ